MQERIKEYLFRRKTELIKQMTDGRRKKGVTPDQTLARIEELDGLWDAITAEQAPEDPPLESEMGSLFP